MIGPGILVRTLSEPGVEDGQGRRWNYHSRSDRHSKVACLAIVIDLMAQCALLRAHVAAGKVAFGLNHEMSDFQNRRKKKLDLVICTPASAGKARATTLADMIREEGLALTEDESRVIAGLPVFPRRPVGAVLVALEAKACMTAHQKALPRLYDELNSSQLTVHGADNGAIAAGFVMINAATEFLSPGRNVGDGEPVINHHKQPFATDITVAKMRELPRRSRPTGDGYDALAIVVIEGRNDGGPFRLVEAPPAPPIGDVYHYASTIDRLASLYATRFSQL